MRDYFRHLSKKLTLQKLGIVIHYFENWERVFHVQVENIIIKHKEIEVDLVEAGNSRCQRLVLRDRFHQIVAHMACKAKVYSTIFILKFILKVCKNHVNRLFGRSNEIDYIGLLVSFPCFFKLLDVVDARNRDQFKKLTTGRKHFECIVINNQNKVVSNES